MNNLLHPIECMTMKAETYNALAAINRGFDVTLESLTILQQNDVLSADYVQQQTEMVEEVRAGMNHMILSKLEAREETDWACWGKLRLETEGRLREANEGNRP
jgi:hypothetical protein